MQSSLNLRMVIVFLPELMVGLYLVRKRNQRVVKIQEQLPDTLDLIARAMQAGHAFSSALLIVGTEGPSPIRDEFQKTFDEINFGIPTPLALHHLEQRVASSDVRFFVVAVLIQLETGGNLTEILKSLSGLIRERQRIAGTVRILSAEGRLSAWILGLLPFGIAAMLSVINPEFISKLWTDPLGIRMLEVSLSLMAVGVWWMWHMVRVKV
jgi:tight adherence protein B